MLSDLDGNMACYDPLDALKMIDQPLKFAVNTRSAGGLVYVSSKAARV